jgi:hypothetical protein
MTMNIDAVIQLIKDRPNIRTVEIADLIDCEPDLIEPALRVHIAAGVITVIPVTAPNGHPANGFVYNGMKAAPAAAALPSVTDIPKLGDQPLHSAMSKVELAIRHLRATGSATSMQLREVMGLSKLQSPVSFLGPAVKDGRVRKHGVNYYPGHPATAGVSTSDTPPLTPPTKKTRAPAALRPQPVGGSASDPAAPAFRCGVWSDGAMELQRDGVTIASLSLAEHAIVAQFSVAALIKISDQSQP